MSVAGDLINDARSFAATTIGSANSEIAAAMETANALGRASPLNTTTNVLPAINIVPPQPGDPGDVPSYEGSHFEAPELTALAPTLAEVGTLRLPPDLGTAPSVSPFNAPRTPTIEPGDASLLAGVPSIVDPDDIDNPPDLLGELAGIEKPVLTEIVIPDAPAFVAPEFLGTAPTDPGAGPADLDRTFRQQFETISPILKDAVNAELDAFIDREFPNFRNGMAAIETRLETYLQGGSALSTEIEDAIYSRTQDKVNADTRRARDKAWGEAARAGFTIPPAILLAQVRDIDQEGRNNNVRAAIDIAVKQAELEQQNLQFAVKTSTELRSIALNAALSYYQGLVQINGQALDYARSIVDALVKVYDLAVKRAEIEARIYEAETRVYEAKLQGALATLQAYKAQIDGERAKADVDVARVNAYRARVDAVNAEANVYRSLVDALVAKTSVERLKVELYQAKVQAYSSQVNAYTAQWQGYSAAVHGEAAKVQASAEPIRAYAAQAEAYRSVVQARATEVDARSRANEAKVREYTAQIEAYRALVMGQSEAVRAEVESYDTTIKAFVAKANAISERSRADIASYEASLRAIIATANIFMDQLRETNKVNIERVHAVAQIATSGAGILGSVAQSALSGMNSLAVQSASEEA